MDGLILVDKPPSFTSHQVVLKIRRILNVKKVGHYGTLDPIATGLMVVGVGKATRLFPFFSKVDKVYRGKIRLGYSTDTYDALGQRSSEESQDYPSKKHLHDIMKSFEGEKDQFPPPFSAKKYRGKPLYMLARQKKDFELKSNKVFIHYFKLVDYNPPHIDFIVKCSSGTYIRSLAHDLGRVLSCGAHVCELVRTEAGDFKLEEGFSLQRIEVLTGKAEIDKFLIPMEILLTDLPKVILKEEGSTLAKHGNLIYPENILRVFDQDSSRVRISGDKDVILRLFSVEGKLLALARKVPEKNGLHPFLVMGSEKKNTQS